MYNTPYTDLSDREALVQLVRAVGVATLVTVDADGLPQATLLPVVWDGGERLVAHAAVANPQFASLDGDVPALAVVNGPDAYVNPEWYPSTRESHRSVPTWNYVLAHLRGMLRVHRDADWLHEAVRGLSAAHVDHHDPRWHFDAMPEKFYAGQLKGIVGLELLVTGVEGKAKLSANRTEADRLAVIQGLAAEDGPGAGGVAEAMRRREAR